MTIVLCLNFGDHIYLAADSQVSSRSKATGRIKAEGHRLKLYGIPGGCNAAIGFSGCVQHAREAVGRIGEFAKSQGEALTEEAMFNTLPRILEQSARSWVRHEDRLKLIFAALTPNSKAYEHEKYPGLGIPPRTFCGQFWIDRESGRAQVLKGSAIHVPSNPEIKMVSPDPRTLVDAFAIGIGAEALRDVEQKYYGMK